MDALNARFRSGGRAQQEGGTKGALASMGVLLSQFDGQDDLERPWRFGSGGYDDRRDRRSAQLIWADMATHVNGPRIPLFNDEFGSREGADADAFGPGFILSSDAFDNDSTTSGGVLCSYIGDGNSFRWLCHPPGASSSCIPGCMSAPPEECTWCADKSESGLPCTLWGGGFGCAYRPDELDQMLAAYVARSGMGYNEVILNAARWAERLPRAIEAVFFLATPRCEASPACRARAVVAHKRFVDDYPEAARDTPLLTMNQSEWHAPFAVSRFAV